MAVKRKNEEDSEQADTIKWFDLQYRKLDGRLFAVPNGGKRSKITAAMLKRTGVRPGVPDLVLPVPMAGYHGLYIEMKKKEGGTVSKEQKDWLQFLLLQGYMAVVCNGFEEAKAVITNYLAGYK